MYIRPVKRGLNAIAESVGNLHQPARASPKLLVVQDDVTGGGQADGAVQVVWSVVVCIPAQANQRSKPKATGRAASAA
jgi:hypothetical protein